MRSGELRHRVQISNPTITVDAYGQPSETFSVTGSRWAKVEEVPLGEQQIKEGTTAKRSITVTVRNLGTQIVSPRSKIAYGGTTFNVSAVADPDGLGVTLVITAEVAD